MTILRRELSIEGGFKASAHYRLYFSVVSNLLINKESNDTNLSEIRQEAISETRTKFKLTNEATLS